MKKRNPNQAPKTIAEAKKALTMEEAGQTALKYYALGTVVGTTFSLYRQEEDPAVRAMLINIKDQLQAVKIEWDKQWKR